MVGGGEVLEKSPTWNAYDGDAVFAAVVAATACNEINKDEKVTAAASQRRATATHVVVGQMRVLII